MKVKGTYLDVMSFLESEMTQAQSRYGEFRSTHEGLGVLIEEVSELVTAIHGNHLADIELEAVQVAAVALRIVECLTYPETKARSTK